MFGTTPTYSIYADESKPDASCKWLLMAVLVIPDAALSEALGQIRAPRARFSYDREVHFQGIRNRPGALHGAKASVALDWVKTVMYDKRGIWNLHIRAVHPQRLSHTNFGHDRPDDNIYTRFFRSTLSYAIKASTGPHDFIINRVFHDDTHLDHHPYFRTSVISRLRWDDSVSFRTDGITFIASNHNTASHGFSEAAEIIQVADVCIGAFRQALTSGSRHAGKIAISEAILPFFKVLNDPSHSCWKYGQKVCPFDHSHRSLAFFPKHRAGQVDSSITADMSTAYYKGESLAMSASTDQLTLL